MIKSKTMSELQLLPAKIDKEKAYKLILSDTLERKIRTFCALSPNREWSGVMFYKFEGDFDNGLTIYANDMYLMDQGSAAHTEFNLNEPEITRYMVFESLTDHCIALIHSHNQMKAFFSGEDASTLTTYGNEMNNFVSLVVNNDGNYVARVTRKITLSGVKKTVLQGTYSYPLFNTGNAVTKKDTSAAQEKFSDSWIEYVDLQIEKPTVDIDDAIARFGEVNHKCTAISTTLPILSPKFERSTSKEEPTLFDNIDDYTLPEDEVLSAEDLDLPQTSNLPFENHGYYKWRNNLLYGTPFYDATDKFAYVDTSLLSKMYTKAFPNKEDFKNWFDFWIDYMVSVFDTSWIKEDWAAEDYLLSKLYRDIYYMKSLKYRECILKIIESRVM